MPRKNRILAISHDRFDGTQLLIPVIKELKKDREFEVVVIGANKTVNERLIGEGIPVRRFADYDVIRFFSALFRGIMLLIENRKAAEDKGSGSKELMHQGNRVVRKIRDIFLKKASISQLLTYIKLWFQHLWQVVFLIIESEDADLIMLCGTRLPQRMAVRIGKVKGIPTLELQGSLFEWHEDPVRTDKLATWGSYTKELYISRGVDPSKLVITGSPKLEMLLERKKSFRKEKIYSRFGIDPKKKIIVFASQPASREERDESEAMVRAIFNETKKLQNIALVVKLHPNQEGIRVRAIARELKAEHVTVIKDINLHELLNACEILITGFSTVGFEAMLLEKPVITVNLTGREDILPYASSGAAVGVYKSEDLAPAINKVLDDKQFKMKLKKKSKMFLNDYIYGLDGNSSKRVKELIISMVNKKEIKY